MAAITNDSSMMNSISAVLIAIIGVFGGAGFWSWKVKKAELEVKYRDDLSSQVKELSKKIEELYDTRAQLAAKVTSLTVELNEAHDEIRTLKLILSKVASP
jgi:outer membrane murein-binding lipoprotein Lpp